MWFDTKHTDVINAVRQALEEDIRGGDITSIACVPEDLKGEGKFRARESFVLAGVELLPLIYSTRGGVDDCELEFGSGDNVREGDVLASVSGRVRTLLECERVTLNFLQRLSGIATLARCFADAVVGTKCRILDTRKTTPGLRRLEKMAAAAGGITNHRMGLYDAILIKNNHVAAAGGVRTALEHCRKTGLPVQIEVHSRAELLEALECGAKRLLLDNFSPEEAAELVKLIGGHANIELSGGITLENVRAYAETGADFISCGAITHSPPAANIHFRLNGT